MSDNVLQFPDKDQEFIDKYYRVHKQGKPCCAGCDHWRWYNIVVGECTKSAPVSAHERWSMIGIRSASLHDDAGHIMTPRDHSCGDFIDTYDWGSK